MVVDSGPAVPACPLGYVPEVPMSNHSGAEIEHTGQKTVGYENGDSESVNVNFEVANVTRRLVSCRNVE